MRKRITEYIFLLLISFLFLFTSFSPSLMCDKNAIINDDLLEKIIHANYDRYNLIDSIEYNHPLLNERVNFDLSNVLIVPDISLQMEVSNGPMDSPWPMKCHDTHHTSLSPYSTADNPYDEVWRFRCDWMNSGIAIDKNGTLYFGSFDRYLYAVYPNGTLKWRYGRTGMWIDSTPAIAEDGTVYVGSWDSRLYAVNPNGTEKWSLGMGGNVASSPAIAEDGTIYVGAMGPGNNGRINAVNPNGTKKWYYDTGFWITGDPAIADDGTIYIGSGDNYFYALYPNGTLRWKFPTGNYIKGPSSIADDGTIYIGSWDSYLYAHNPNGTMKWRHQVGSGTESNPSIGPDGTIYVGGEYLYAIYPNGTRKWTFDFGSNRHSHQSSPAISADGIIYISIIIGDDTGGEIVAVNPNGTERWRQWIGNNEGQSSPSIGSDGTIYVGSSFDVSGDCYGYVYAFGWGDLQADANGPYSGNVQVPVQFTGTASGGTHIYTYHWDFGDGNTSNEQNPIYTYTSPGNYTATFTVTDSENNISSDTAMVMISYASPTITITKPDNGIYILNIRIFPFSKPFILGPITVEVSAHQEPLGINHVEFYVDEEIIATDTIEPYSYTWNQFSFGRHNIKVIVYDTLENTASDDTTVWKFF